MAVPTLITDLSTTPASNSPAGSENVFPNLDDYLRAQSAFLASVRDNSGNGWVSPYLPLAGGTMTGTVAGLQISSLNGGAVSLRNKIINGNMGVFQRGTAAVTTNNTTGPADRWRTNVVGDTFSTSQGTFVSGDTLYDTGGAQYFTQIAVTSVANAANFCVFGQAIEDVRILAGQTVTVSFWAKAASGTPSIGLSLDQEFGSGGSPSTAVNGTGQAQALTTTWTKYTKTFSIPSINGKTIGTTATTSFTILYFWLDAGSNNDTRSGSIGQASKTVSIAQVQLEVGPVATPFEQRPYGMELALCQRYYFAYGNFHVGINGNANAQGDGAFPVTMRGTPGLAYTDDAGTSTQVTVWNGALNRTTFAGGGFSPGPSRLVLDATLTFNNATSSWMRAYNVTLSAEL